MLGAKLLYSCKALCRSQKLGRYAVAAMVLSISLQALAGTDEKTDLLVGEWVIQNNGDPARSLTIDKDYTIQDSIRGEGDIQRISGNRYRLTFYGLGQPCEVIIKPSRDENEFISTDYSGQKICLIYGKMTRVSRPAADDGNVPATAKLSPATVCR